MLGEFSAVKVDTAQKSPAAPVSNAETKTDPTKEGTKEADAVPNLDDAFSEDDFAKQLQAGMADLLGELEKTVSAMSVEAV